LHLNFTREIPLNPENLLEIPQKRRNLVRKAQKLGASWTIDTELKDFFSLYSENARAHGTPSLNERFFKEVIDSLGESVEILTVRNSKGEAVSSIMNFYFRSTVMSYFAGENEEARSLSANDFKYWAVMCHSRLKGASIFDLGRSKKGSGNVVFKELWGFEASQIYCQFPYLPSGQIPGNNPTNPKFKLAISVWRKLPRIVTDSLGPRLIHGLG
jgi:FemAB-related protein (PEP-CTERM system-associated)